ncbi:MAG: hypothetical protein AB7I32_07585 [Gammaproteobacteria bacterium]
MDPPITAVCGGLERAVEEALAGLQGHQTAMTRLFSVGVDILNASRALDTMAFDLQLLAQNGVVQAAQMNHAAGGQKRGEGKSLLALAEILADCPREIGPSLAELGGRCQAIATHTAHCMGLARQHVQHLKALLAVLSREAVAGGDVELVRELAATPLRSPAVPPKLARVCDRWALAPELRANVGLIAERCTATLKELTGHLAATAACLRATDVVLHAIGRVGGTVNYLGINVAIEAAHCDARGSNFRQLAQDIEKTVASLQQKLAAIRDSADRGRVLVKVLGA